MTTDQAVDQAWEALKNSFVGASETLALQSIERLEKPIFLSEYTHPHLCGTNERIAIYALAEFTQHGNLKRYTVLAQSTDSRYSRDISPYSIQAKEIRKEVDQIFKSY